MSTRKSSTRKVKIITSRYGNRPIHIDGLHGQGGV
jgi:hypothetical protein